MENDQNWSKEQAHKWFAVDLNQLAWKLMEKADRTKSEDELLEHAAHTSMYHWLQVGEAINAQRAAWLLSRVYAVLNEPGQCFYYAEKCMDLTQANSFGDFDLAYAFEAMYRACLLNEEEEEAEEFKNNAEEAGKNIVRAEDREIFFKDFNFEL